jgi:hypothetical protein
LAADIACDNKRAVVFSWPLLLLLQASSFKLQVVVGWLAGWLAAVVAAAATIIS